MSSPLATDPHRAGIIRAIQNEFDGWSADALQSRDAETLVNPLNWAYRATFLILAARKGQETADRAAGRRLILDSIRVGQFRENSHPCDGIFHWSRSLTGAIEPPRDRNTPGFYCCAILRAWAFDPLRFSDWPESELSELKDAIRAAWNAAVRLPVRIGYTNPQCLDLFFGFVAADLLGDDSIRAHCRKHLADLIAFTKTCDSVEEFASPTYMAVNLSGILPLAEYVHETPDAQPVNELLRLLWRMTATAAHPPTSEICFPHSRAYEDSLIRQPSTMYAWLHLASPDKFPMTIVSASDAEGKERTTSADSFAALSGAGLLCPLRIPDDALTALRSDFSQPVETRENVEWIGRCGWKPPFDLSRPSQPAPRFRLITRYKTSRFCVGSVNEIDSWQQRRGCGAYWNDLAGKTTGLIFRLLLDFEPDASLSGKLSDMHLSDWPLRQAVELVTAQRRETVIGAFRTATILAAKPGDRLGTPAESMNATMRNALIPKDPAAWLVGTHWRQPIEKPLTIQRVQRFALRVSPVGDGQWTRLNDAGTLWSFDCNGIAAVIETTRGARVVKEPLPPTKPGVKRVISSAFNNATKQAIDPALLDDAVEQLELGAWTDIDFNWLSPIDFFEPFRLSVGATGLARAADLKATGDSKRFELATGDGLGLRYEAISRPDAVEKRTWFGTSDGKPILPNGYDR